MVHNDRGKRERGEEGHRPGRMRHLEQGEGALEVALHVVVHEVKEEGDEAPVQVQALPYILHLPHPHPQARTPDRP